jgi:hypothetical protein
VNGTTEGLSGGVTAGDAVDQRVNVTLPPLLDGAVASKGK